MNIISFISTWLKDIVILFILISIAELVMPNGNMKKYINMVIGLLIIFTIISPLAKLLKLNLNLEQAVFNYSRSSVVVDMKDKDLYIQQEKQIEKIYKERISNEVKELIEEKTDYRVIGIEVQIITEKGTYGEIKYLDILLSEDTGPINEGKIHIKKVKPIEVQNKSIEENIPNEGNEEVRNIVSNSYLVDMDKINVKVIKKGNGE